MPDRAAAWELLCEYTKGDSLRKHALAVEAAMRACAKRYAEGPADEDEWGLVRLLPDSEQCLRSPVVQLAAECQSYLCANSESMRRQRERV
jgi:hypothetical protein